MAVNLRDVHMKEVAWRHWESQGMYRQRFEELYDSTIDHLEESQAMVARGEISLTEDDEKDRIC